MSVGAAATPSRKLRFGARTALLICLPAFAVLLSLLAWIAGVSRSGFWADDFLNLTHFSNSLGDLSNNRINEGKYIINLFWAIGTTAFGTGSVVPYLLLNSLVFAVGLVLWLRAGSGTRWGPVGAWWIGGLFLATGAWLPTVLWSSNITHSGGFLALGAAMWCHERCMRSDTRNAAWSWALACGGLWLFAIVSNLLYVGLLAIAAYCVLHQTIKLRDLGAPAARAAAIGAACSLVVPLVFFFAVAYPGTQSSAVYANHGVKFIHANYDYYKYLLAPTTLLEIGYAITVVVSLAGAALAARRRDLFPAAILLAAAGTALPALVQGTQREIHYVAMPLLLTFTAAALGARAVLSIGPPRRVAGTAAAIAAAAVMLLLVFEQGATVRHYFVATPFGSRLTSLRSDIAERTLEGGTICAMLDVEPKEQALFIAEMSGEDGFLVSPISAGRVFLVPKGSPCPVPGAISVDIGIDPRGDFMVSG